MKKVERVNYKFFIIKKCFDILCNHVYIFTIYY